MTPVVLLDELKKFIQEQTKNIILPVKSKPDTNGPAGRAAEVHIMRLPEKDEDEGKYAPYILLQFLTGKDSQKAGEPPESECKIRIVVVIYSKNCSDGALHVLNILTRIRVALLKVGIISEQFQINMPLEYVVYPDNGDFYFMGEMMTIWELFPIEREGYLGC